MPVRGQADGSQRGEQAAAGGEVSRILEKAHSRSHTCALCCDTIHVAPSISCTSTEKLYGSNG